MTGGRAGAVRPVVPQDLAAAAMRVVLGLVAVLVAVRVWDSPLLGLLAVVGVAGWLGLGLIQEPWQYARTWVADLDDVPLVPAVVVPERAAVRVGLLLGGAGGLALVLAACVVVATSAPTYVVLLPMSLVVVRSIERLLTTRAVRRWERERDVVLCRRPTDQRFVLLHETDVERMVVVPAR